MWGGTDRPSRETTGRAGERTMGTATYGQRVQAKDKGKWQAANRRHQLQTAIHCRRPPPPLPLTDGPAPDASEFAFQTSFVKVRQESLIGTSLHRGFSCSCLRPPLVVLVAWCYCKAWVGASPAASHRPRRWRGGGLGGGTEGKSGTCDRTDPRPQTSQTVEAPHTHAPGGDPRTSWMGGGREGALHHIRRGDRDTGPDCPGPPSSHIRGRLHFPSGRRGGGADQASHRTRQNQ